MDLVPSERAVLNLIRVLYFEASARTHCLTTLRSRWPVLHDAAYTSGYQGLVRKSMIAQSLDGQSFSITAMGLKAIAMLRTG